MGRDLTYRYFVEVETEKKLIEEFKKVGTLVVSGAVSVLDVTKHRLSNARLANLRERTVVILVFDTDGDNIAILEENIRKLKQTKNVEDILCALQVKNLEEELIRATDVKKAKDLIGCQSDKDFKREFIREKRLMHKLYSHNFDIKKFWSTEATGIFGKYKNNGEEIKLS